MDRTCPFIDHSLICFESFEPKNLSLARVETKTFIKLLYEHMLLGKNNIQEDVMSSFFQSYDEAMIKVAEVDSIIKNSKRFLDQTSFMDKTEKLKYQAFILNELGEYEEHLRTMLNELQRMLYDATIRRDRVSFVKYITEATNDMDTIVAKMYEMIP